MSHNYEFSLHQKCEIDQTSEKSISTIYCILRIREKYDHVNRNRKKLLIKPNTYKASK